VQPLKDVEPQVEDALYSQRMAPALRQYLTRLREESYIDIKQGYEDAGASPNETKPSYSAYAPPTGKKKKHVERTRFRQKSTQAKPATQTASAPATVPSLADVPQGNAAQTAATTETASATPPASPAATSATNTQVAGSGVEKPGKKEKIRFGQAPRETLPAAPTKTEDAGANGAATTQVATNNVPQNMQVVGPDGTVENQSVQEKQEKTRFSARAKQPKQKKSKDKTDPFAPAPENQNEFATRQEQSTPLGLNGDTAKPKKAPKPTEKARLSDKAKEKPEGDQQPNPPSAGEQAAPPAGTPAPTAQQP
jgi:peptidyl-prolyl cis-trans isomerase SurA